MFCLYIYTSHLIILMCSLENRSDKNKTDDGNFNLDCKVLSARIVLFCAPVADYDAILASFMLRFTWLLTIIPEIKCHISWVWVGLNSTVEIWTISFNLQVEIILLIGSYLFKLPLIAQNMWFFWMFYHSLFGIDLVVEGCIITGRHIFFYYCQVDDCLMNMQSISPFI